MIRNLTFVLLAAIYFVAPSHAQQPYAGLETRPIKALSTQQIEDLKAGRGMSLALAAELNGYPGPLHVIELANSLELSEAQRRGVEAFFSEMKTEAIAIGEKLIQEEADLDRQFSDKTITAASLATSLQSIAAVQATLRAAHLKYHLATAEILTPTQIKKYSDLRGYNNPQSGTQHQKKHH